MPTPTSTVAEKEGSTGTDWISAIRPNSFLGSWCRANGGKVMTVPMQRPSDDPRMEPVRIRFNAEDQARQACSGGPGMCLGNI